MQWASLLLDKPELCTDRQTQLLDQTAAACIHFHILGENRSGFFDTESMWPEHWKQTHTAQWRKSKVFLYNKYVNQTVYLKATGTSCRMGSIHWIPHIRKDTVGAFYKTKRATLFPFVIITRSVLFFSFPWTFPPFHRDTDENLMKPGTVGAPPGDLRVEYFNCTFTPSVCLQTRHCSRIRRTVSHKLKALHTI